MVCGLIARYRARRAYFAADREARWVWAEFAAPEGDWWSRCETLLEMAECEREMAETVVGFRDAGGRDENGFTAAQWHNLSADLLEMVAATETPVGAGPDDVWRVGQALVLSAAHGTGLAADPAVAAVLEQMADADALWTRAELTLALFDVVVDRVGCQAAGVLPWVARGYYRASGLSESDARWLTGPDGPRWTR